MVFGKIISLDRTTEKLVRYRLYFGKEEII